MAFKLTPIPAFHNPQNAFDYNYDPQADQLLIEAGSYRKANSITRPADDIRLLIIDGQKDFCFPQGKLYVGGRSGKGAMEDNQRLSQFIYKNMANLSHVNVTLDTHGSHHVFFASFFVKADGTAPGPYQTVQNKGGVMMSERDGALEVNPAILHWLCQGNALWAKRQVLFYMDQLAKGGKYMLYLWPSHCVIGTSGHALAGVLSEAVLFHSFVHGVEYTYETKGQNPWTENYSVLAPESLLRWDGQGAIAEKNQSFIDQLISAKKLIIGGQAASHCVKSTIAHLLDEIVNIKKAPELAKKVYILRDCMSAVVVPGGPDYTPDAEAALAQFAAAGMNVVDSTTPMDQWPGINS